MDLKGKQLSLASKIVAVVIVIICLTVNAVTPFTVPMDDAIKAAVFVALAFSPVDVSMWINNYGAWHRKTFPDDGKDDGDSPA